MAVDEKVVEEKVAKGEELTKEEQEFVMGGAPDANADDADLGVDEKDIEDEDKGGKNKVPGGPEDAGKTGGPEKKEETPEEKEAREQKEKEDADAKAKADADAAAAKKAAEDKEKEKEPDMAKIEAEAAKADGQEDIKDFSPREKGLFYGMRKAIRRAQKAEEERDAVLFVKIKDDMAKKNKKEPEEDPDPDAFITKADQKKRDEAAALETEARDRQIVVVLSEADARSRIAARRIEDKELPDFDKVMEIGEEIIKTNEDYKKKIFLAYKTGKNPALTMYDLVRNDPAFAEKYGKPAAVKKEEKPPEAAKKPDIATADKINANEVKAKTTGAAGAGGAYKVGDKEYTLTEISAMSPRQFSKLPKAVREKFLQDAG